MGQFRDVERMFSGVTYNKFTSGQLRTAMAKKIEAVLTKVKEREGRINKLMAENNITSEMATDMVLQYMKDQQEGRQRMMYSNSVRSQTPDAPPKEINIPAGVIANLITEKSLIEIEQEEVKRMVIILRNLKDEEYYFEPRTGERHSRECIHTLSDNDMEYLGF